MTTYFVDETGFTGEDLLALEQPVFVQSINDFTNEEAEAIIRETFGGVEVHELKHSRLIRNPRHRGRIIELVRIVADNPVRAGSWIAHKEFALMTLIVDWWLEPLAYKSGLNLYKEGANIGMANMLFVCLEGFWSKKFRQKLLLNFQRMIRTRNKKIFAACEKFIRTERGKCEGDRAEILKYLWPSFHLLGYSVVSQFEIRSLVPSRIWRAIPICLA